MRNFLVFAPTHKSPAGIQPNPSVKNRCSGGERPRQGKRPGSVAQLARRAEGIRKEVLQSAGRLLGDAPHPVQVAVRPVRQHLG
jgi:hypothetical protein